VKFFGRPFNETTKANAGKLELALALFHEKLIHDVEKALRLDTPLFRAFHNFSNVEIQAAIEEARGAGSDTVVLEASVYANAAAEFEAIFAAEAANRKAFPAYVPSPFAKLGNAPAPASVPTSLSEPNHPFFIPAGVAPRPVPEYTQAPVPTPPPATATAPQVGAAAEAAAHVVEAAAKPNPVPAPFVGSTPKIEPKNPFSTLAGEAPRPGSNEPTN
jgi:hypothetical protein